MAELVEDSASFKKFTLIGHDVFRGLGRDQAEASPSSHETLQFDFQVFFSCEAF
jgi:hypothetical protein